MTIFVTSDLHFGHKNILKFNPETRPYDSIEEHDEALVDNWNSVVGPNDTVWNLGDLSFHRDFNKTLDILERLNGQHHLILGNHDQLLRKFRFAEAAKNAGVASISDYHELRINKQKICMSHYAMRVWNCMHHGALMLYGHSHGSLPGVGRQMDVGIDACDMPSNQRPFAIEDVIEFLSAKEAIYFDHHRVQNPEVS